MPSFNISLSKRN